MTLTNTDLDQLDALAQAATPGPWWVDAGGSDESSSLVGADNHEIASLPYYSPYRRKPDERFIAASRLAIPALVAEVRRLRAEEERPWLGCPGCAGALAGLVDRLCGSCRKQTVAAFGCGAPDCRPRCSSCSRPPESP